MTASLEAAHEANRLRGIQDAKDGKEIIYLPCRNL